MLYFTLLLTLAWVSPCLRYCKLMVEITAGGTIENRHIYIYITILGITIDSRPLQRFFGGANMFLFRYWVSRKTFLILT
ncbi:hypothetical protein XELAEV_18006154mg [Xenopus laevis]|uniref:Secreted protein n=1 Tax=Xenopus laevis TaxID=8355 RepID=A0A974DYD2_XENLA|nr:hypothetical protein XELAEV_18006154mg [Xenopus laevis]